MFSPAPLAGACVITPERLGDERGWFARLFDAATFAELGMDPAVVQTSLSYNARAGTLRGLHYQAAPHAEAKLVRCTRGAAFDVIVDLRPRSATFGRWAAFELSCDNQRMVFVPAGFAHGFQTLADDTELFYQMSEFHCPEAARGVRWDDPSLGIAWPPCARRILSSRDLSYPELRPCGAS